MRSSYKAKLSGRVMPVNLELLIFSSFCIALIPVAAATLSNEKSINFEIVINASIDDVWNAWTTEEGAKSFFAPDCKIELLPNGKYEMYFLPEAPEGQRGGEGCKILAVQEKKLFSFSWNSPPIFPEVRFQYTTVILRFEKLSQNKTRLYFTEIGWGDGGGWDKSFEYFTKAWGKVVLPRLQYRFENGPVDWNNPPKL